MAEIPVRLPPDVAADTVWTKSQVNRIYAYLDVVVDPPRFWDEVTLLLETGEETSLPQWFSGSPSHDAARYEVGLSANHSLDIVTVDTGGDGLYLVGGSYIETEPPTVGNTGLRYMRIQREQSSANEIEYRCSASTANVSGFTVCGLIHLAEGESLRWRVYQSSANAATYQSVTCQMWAHWIGNRAA